MAPLLKIPVACLSFIGKSFSQGAAFGAGASIVIIYIFAVWFRPLADTLASFRW